MTPGISILSASSPGKKLLVQAMPPECLCCQFEFTSRNCWYRLWRLNVHVVRSSGEKLLVQAVTPECSCCQIIRRETAGTGCDAWMFMLSDHQERNCWYRLWRLNVHVVRSSGEKLLVQAVTPECSWCQDEFTRRETAGPGYDVWMFMSVQTKFTRRETAGLGYDAWIFMSAWVHQKLLVQAMTPECSCCQIKFIKRETAGAGYDTWMFTSDQVHQNRNCWFSL